MSRVGAACKPLPASRARHALRSRQECTLRQPRPFKHRTGTVAALPGEAASPSGTATSDVPARLALVYYELRNPSRAFRPYSAAITDFAANAVTAYECGFNEADMCAVLRMAVLEDAQVALLGLQDADVEELVCCVSVVWVTLMSLRTTRWATGSAVSDSTLSRWAAFVRTIEDAYLNKRMTWMPLERLRLELQLHSLPPPSPDGVEERARLVFATLEQVAPQFPQA